MNLTTNPNPYFDNRIKSYIWILTPEDQLFKIFFLNYNFLFTYNLIYRQTWAFSIYFKYLFILKITKIGNQPTSFNTLFYNFNYFKSNKLASLFKKTSFENPKFYFPMTKLCNNGILLLFLQKYFIMFSQI